MGKVVHLRKAGRARRTRPSRGWHPSARRTRPRRGWFPYALVGLPLGAFCAVLLMPGDRGTAAAFPAKPSTPAIDAQFARCSGPARYTCVVDGDTLWVEGTKIRLADINTPEISRPDCAEERALGERATTRLVALLNRGPFVLEREGPDEDRYGRKLSVALRDGESLGETLVAEGLAEEWTGPRRNWCG